MPPTKPSKRPHLSLSETHTRKILVVQPAQNGHGQRVTDGLDGAGDRCILVQ